MQVHRDELHVARVIGEDETSIVLEVPKSEEHTFELSEHSDFNKFYTVIFVHTEDGVGKIWTPWEWEEGAE